MGLLARGEEELHHCRYHVGFAPGWQRGREAGKVGLWLGRGGAPRPCREVMRAREDEKGFFVIFVFISLTPITKGQR
jgi:hypothetical protein